MLEIIILFLFIILLLSCSFLHISIILGLIAGYFLFFLYGLLKRYRPEQLFTVSLSGIKNVKNIIIIFLLIGLLTASWRTSGTIASLITYFIQLINPSFFILFSFLLNCMMSFLTGTAFGTAATTGALCMMIARIFHCDLVITGGAVVSGCYFGDRCSPVSSCMLLVSQITQTNMYDNLKKFLTFCMPPFFITCAIYLTSGYFFPCSTSESDISSILQCYSEEFYIHSITLIPVAVIIICTFFKLNIKYIIFLSTCSAAAISIFMQHMPLNELIPALIWGYTAKTEELKPMLNGGGLCSMTKACSIIFISSMYSGLFHLTGLLDSIRLCCKKISCTANNFSAVLLASLFSCIVSCNQPFGIILTNELTKELKLSKEKKALYLANTSAILPPLFFWNIAAATTLASCNAPAISPFAACFLYIVPIYTLILSFSK